MATSPSILFVNLNYYPDFVSAGQRLQDLAEYLVADGFDVSVLCGRGGYEGESSQAPRRQILNGVRVRRLPMPHFGRATTLGRLTDYAAFFVQALARLLVTRRYDRVIFLTTPPLLAAVGPVLHLLRGQSYGIWSMDLHPDAEKALGMLRPQAVATRTLDALNNAAHRRADFVVALGPYMKKRLIAKGVVPERIPIFPMWTRGMDAVPDADNPYLDELGLADKCVVLYSGNAGLAHRFDEVCTVMKHVRDHPDLFFLFLGGGPRREEITAFAEEHGVQNFHYHDYIPRDQVKYFLSLADVHLLTLRDDMAGIAVPSKLYDSMAASRPVVMVGPQASEPAETIKQGGFGYVVDPVAGGTQAAVARLVEALGALQGAPDRRRALGQQGRAMYERTYRRDVVCASWAAFLRRQLASPDASPPVEQTTPGEATAPNGRKISANIPA